MFDVCPPKIGLTELCHQPTPKHHLLHHSRPTTTLPISSALRCHLHHLLDHATTHMSTLCAADPNATRFDGGVWLVRVVARGGVGGAGGGTTGGAVMGLGERGILQQKKNPTILFLFTIIFGDF